MWKQLGLGDFAEANLPAAQEWGRYPADTKVCKGHALFPRYDLKEEVAEAEEEKKAAQACPAARNRRSRKSLSTISARSTSASAKYVACEKVPKAKKLLKLQVDLGTETRQIVSGISLYYKPEDLIGTASSSSPT